MNRFLATFAVVACAYGAPSADYAAGLAGVGHLGGYAAGVSHVSAPVAVGQTHHSYAAGPPVVENHVEYGVVGHETRQVGVQQVQTGHAYHVAGVETIPQPAHTYQAGPARNTVKTVPIAPPAIPAAPAPYAAIPPAPVNLGPAPADTVTHERVLAPSRTHTIITPQATRIEPELQVNKYQA